jgi:6-phosphogluconolactonase (cycloisomerase 2 family)
MQKRFTWVLAVAVLLLAAFLVACSSKYSSTDNGLVVVSTQGNAVMDTFSLDLGNGHMTEIYNTNGPPTNGVPTTVVLGPGGAYAYLLVTQSVDYPGSVTGIQTFSVASDGKLGNVGSTTPLSGTPTGMIIDAAGQYLFVSESTPGTVAVFSVGSGGTLTQTDSVPLPVPIGGQTPNASALAVTPTVYPPAYAACSGNVAPTTENLYVTDYLNYIVVNYLVSSTGTLTLVPPSASEVGIATGPFPSGVTVDPCNRFVYVSNGEPNNSVSAYTICMNVSLPGCPYSNFSLQPVQGSPFTAGPAPGPLLVDPLGNFLYVLDEGENAIRPYKISTTTGALTPSNPATVATNASPVAMAIRSDDSWMFVTNLNQTNMSQYAITPSTGQLTPQPPVQTDSNPWGVAVK